MGTTVRARTLLETHISKSRYGHPARITFEMVLGGLQAYAFTARLMGAIEANRDNSWPYGGIEQLLTEYKTRQKG